MLTLFLESVDPKMWSTTYEQGHGCSSWFTWICTSDAVPVLILSSDLLPTFNQLPWFEFETFLIIGSEFNELLLLSLMKLGCLLGYSTSSIWCRCKSTMLCMMHLLGLVASLNVKWTCDTFLPGIASCMCRVGIQISIGQDILFLRCLFAWNENENELKFIPNTHPFHFWLSNSKDSGMNSSFLCETYNYSDSC